MQSKQYQRMIKDICKILERNLVEPSSLDTIFNNVKNKVRLTKW